MTGSKSVSDARARQRGLRLSGLAAALIVAALLIPAGEYLRRPLFDAWQRISPRDLSDTKVRVVEIDSASLEALGMWPWPRFYLAQLTHEIARRGAVAIGYDVLFAEPDRVAPEKFAALYPEMSAAAVAELGGLETPDAVFGGIVGQSPVVLARAGTHEAEGASAHSVDAQVPARLPPAFRRFPRAVAAIPEIGDVALGHGLVNAEPDSDGIYRQVPLLATIDKTVMPGFAIEVARVAMTQDAIGLAGARVTLGDRSLPINARGEMRLRFGRFPEDKKISAADLIRQGGPQSLAGLAVLVGPAAEGTTDIAATPLEAKQYGVLVQAQALDAILRGSGWLERPRWAGLAEWAVAATMVLLALWLLPLHDRKQFLVPLGAVAAAVAAWLLFDRWSLLFDPIPTVAMAAASAIGVGAASSLQTRRERERLRETLVEERVTSAANEAELSAARSIQQAMLPRPELLARLDPRIEIAARLEPARSVGGDFFDMVRLDACRIAFSIADVTGKGVPASLFMALSKALAKSAMLRENLDVLAPVIQTELSRDAPDEMGLTMLIGVLDLETGEARLINAGHENPFVLRAGGGIEEVPMEGGPPFCITDYPWPVEPLKLFPGDTLLLVTDGVTEAQDAGEQLFGRERLEAALKGDATPNALIERVLAQVRAFEGETEASDDVTLLAIRLRDIPLPGSG